MTKRRLSSLAGLVLCLLATGCAAPMGPVVPRDKQNVPAQWLEQFEPTRVVTRVQAQAALEAIAQASKEREREFLIAERACYSRFLVNSCVEDVAARRRLYELRYSVLKIHARQMVRNDEELQLNQRQAEALAERDRERIDAQTRQAQAAQDSERRVLAQREKEVERQRDLATQAAEQPQREARQAQLQADVAQRRETLARRQAQAGANARARAQREDEVAQKRREREERLVKQREEAARKASERQAEQQRQEQRRAERESRRLQSAKPSAPLQPGVIRDVP